MSKDITVRSLGVRIGTLLAPPPAFNIKNGIKAASDFISKKLPGSHPLIVSVAGESGSGKSTIAKFLANRLQSLYPHLKIRILTMDDYYLGQEFVKDGNFDDPNIIDQEKLKFNLFSVKCGKPSLKPVYEEKARKMKKDAEVLEPPDILILDGLWALKPEFRRFADLGIYVETDPHTNLLRRIARDVSRWGWTPAETIERCSKTVDPMARIHIKPTRFNAHLIIGNPLTPGEKVLFSRETNGHILDLRERITNFPDIIITPGVLSPEIKKPTYLCLFGVPGAGKSTIRKELSKRDPSLVFISMGDEMMETCSRLPAGQFAEKGFVGRGRDDLRAAPVAAHDWLIDKTLERIAKKYADPSKIYIIEGHNVINMEAGFTLGLSPFRKASPPIDISASIVLTADPDIIAERSKSDKSRKRESRPRIIAFQQELMKAIARLNSEVLGSPQIEIKVPVREIREEKYQAIIIGLHEQIYRLAAKRHTKEDLEKLKAYFNYSKLKEAFENGQIYELFPELRHLDPGTLAHKLLLLEDFQRFTEHDFAFIYGKLSHKDAPFPEYSKGFEVLYQNYAELSTEEKDLMWFIAIFHDIGKVVDRRSFHTEIGSRIVKIMAQSMGFDAKTCVMLQALEEYHGWLGGAILAEQSPDLFLKMLDRLEAQEIDIEKFLTMIVIMNMMDLCSFAGGKIARHEYLLEFVSFLNRAGIEKLRDNWHEERIKRLSKPFDGDFFGPFDEDHYQEFKTLIEKMIPLHEKELFYRYLQNYFPCLSLSNLMLSLSLKNRVKLLRILVNLCETRNFSALNVVPPAFTDRDKINQFFDSIPDNFSDQDFYDNLAENSIFGLRYYVQENRLHLELPAT